MLNKYFRASILAALAFLSVPNLANAFVTALPDPFLGQSVDLKASPPGTLIALPGTGPGGATLYASDFVISAFAYVGSSTSAGGTINSYTATFTVNFLDASGNPAIIPTGPNAGQQGKAVLTGGSFVVDYLTRTSPFQTGTFTMNLQTATFSGLTNLGTSLYVDLANIPSAQVSIALGTGGYDVTYLQNFNVQGQYFNNSTGTGTPNTVPTLGDANSGLAPAPEPSTIELLALSLLIVLGLRSRQTKLANREMVAA